MALLVLINMIGSNWIDLNQAMRIEYVMKCMVYEPPGSVLFGWEALLLAADVVARPFHCLPDRMQQLVAYSHT